MTRSRSLVRAVQASATPVCSQSVKSAEKGGAHGRHKGGDRTHLDLRIAALDALGRTWEVQELRWAAFQSWLSVPHLRAYLRGLPDFDDVEAEDRAIAHALSHPDRGLALAFLTTWPNLEAANRLVRAHCAELDGGDYSRLRPAAEALAEKYPVAATLRPALARLIRSGAPELRDAWWRGKGDMRATTSPRRLIRYTRS